MAKTQLVRPTGLSKLSSSPMRSCGGDRLRPHAFVQLFEKKLEDGSSPQYPRKNWAHASLRSLNATQDDALWTLGGQC